MEKLIHNWLDAEVPRVATTGDAEAQATLKPWHAPQLTVLELKSTLGASGSHDDGLGSYSGPG